MFVPDVFSTPPLSVNDLGVKFWLDRSTTNYAHRKGLADVVVLYAEEANGTRTRLITQGQDIVYEHQGFEDIVCHIDIMALDKLEGTSSRTMTNEEKATEILRLCYLHFAEPRSDKRDTRMEKIIQGIIEGGISPTTEKL